MLFSGSLAILVMSELGHMQSKSEFRMQDIMMSNFQICFGVHGKWHINICDKIFPLYSSIYYSACILSFSLSQGSLQRQADHNPFFFFSKQVFFCRNLIQPSISPDVSIHSSVAVLAAQLLHFPNFRRQLQIMSQSHSQGVIHSCQLTPPRSSTLASGF